MNAAIAQISQAASLIVPEVVLLVTVCCMFLTGPFLVSDTGQAPDRLRYRWGGLSLLALGTAWLIWFNTPPKSVTGGPFVADELVWYVRGLSLTMGAVLTLLLWNQIDDGHAAEAHACLLTVIVGTNFVAASNDLVGLFLSLEMVSIPTYVLLYLPRRDPATREATIKYFLLSVFSSALVLYGMSWLFGATGTTSLSGIAQVLAGSSGVNSGPLGLALALLVAGLCFRITAVPFHFYAPDVFQGVTPFNAALLSFMPKVVGFVALLRLIPLTGATINVHDWRPDSSAGLLLAVLALATMFVGNLMALRQTHLYRLMAYSSVAHAGYMLIGLAVGNVGFIGGTSAVLFYLPVYGLMTIGVFALLTGLGTAERPLRTDSDLRGLSSVRPTAALLLAVCLFSLTGLPPTAGFLGKLNLFLAAWSADDLSGQVLSAALALNAAIAAWYYLRLIALMFLDSPTRSESETPPVDWIPWLAGAACAVATVVLFVSPQWLWDIVLRAAGQGA
jgi:NADH-quinone oxidoreductase subunit N